MDTREFLQTVLPERDTYVLHIARGNSRFNNNYGSLDSVCEAIESFDASEATVYFAVGKFANNLERNESSGRMVARRKKQYATYFRSLCVDIDVGPGHKYATQAEAAKDLYAAARSLGLPLPMLVDSGTGVHGYWPLDRDIKAATWEQMSMALRAALSSQGVEADWSKIHDASMVLRPVGSHHKKDPQNWKPVRVAKAQPVSDALVVAERLKPYKGMVQAPSAPAGKRRSAMLDAVLNDERPIKLEDLRRCKQVSAVLATGGVTDAAGDPVMEPMWRAMLGIAKYCDDKEDAAIRLGGHHPEFDLDENMEKMNAWEGSGPTTCGFLESLCPSGCTGCPHKGKIKTPASLSYVGKQTVQAVIPDTQSEEEFPYTSIEIKGYSFSGDWLLYTPPGSDETKPVCQYNMFVVGMVSNTDMDRQMAKIAVRIPREGAKATEGWTTIDIPMDIIAKGGGDLAAALANRSVYITTDIRPVRAYLMTYLATLRRSKNIEFSCSHFGWQPDGSFLGSTGLIGPVESDKVNLEGTAKHYGKSITTEGTLDSWVKATRLFAHDQLEYHGLVLLMMLGSPIFEGAGVPSALVNCYSRDSGSGKTIVGLFGLSAYGNPTELMRTVNDTDNSLYKFLGTMRNFGFYVDEITMVDPHRLRGLVYTLPEGREKERLGRDADSFRELAHWRTPAFSSSNRDLYEALNLRMSSEGERYRVMQFPFDRVPLFGNDPRIGYQVYRTITQNYGHVGPLLMQKVLDAGGPRAVFDAAEARFEEMYGFKFLGQERYFRALFATAEAIGAIAQDAGLILFDAETVIRRGLAYMETLRSGFASEVMGGLDVIDQFMTEHANDMVHIAIKETQAGADSVVPHPPPRRAAVARTEIKRDRTGRFVAGRYYINKPIFRRWCTENGAEYKAVLLDLRREGVRFSDQARKCLYKGIEGQSAAGQSYCIELDVASHPRLIASQDNLLTSLDDSRPRLAAVEN